MSKRPSADFLKILAQSDVPTTEEQFEEKLKQEVIGAGSEISNDSAMSPFWRWVRAAVITPCLWLIKTLLAGHVLPNMYVATAERWALELKAWEHDIEPKGAVKTQGLITLTKANAADAVSIDAGKIIQTLPIDNITFKVKVLEQTVIEVGELTGKVLVEAENAGQAYNLPAGYFNILPEEIPGIVAAVNEPDWVTRSGANQESDEELALRIQNAFTSSGEWHIDDVYRAMISKVAGIRSDNIFFQNTGEITPGTADAFILMEVGATPVKVLEQLNSHIMSQGNHGHGDVLTCKAIPDTLHDVIAEAELVANLDEQQTVNVFEEIEQRVRAAFRDIEAYSEMTRARPLSRFSLSICATEIHNNMDDVKSIRFIVDGNLQKDIESQLTQPRLKTLVVREMLDE